MTLDWSSGPLRAEVNLISRDLRRVTKTADLQPAKLGKPQRCALKRYHFEKRCETFGHCGSLANREPLSVRTIWTNHADATAKSDNIACQGQVQMSRRASWSKNHPVKLSVYGFYRPVPKRGGQHSDCGSFCRFMEQERTFENSRVRRPSP